MNNGDGKRVGTIDSTGGLNYPQNLFVDASGDLWVANEGGHDGADAGSEDGNALTWAPAPLASNRA